MYADALLLLFEMADREDERFQAAAARWHARLILEARLPLRDAEGVMTLLCRLRGADRHIVRRRLLLSVERAGLTTREISRELPRPVSAFEKAWVSMPDYRYELRRGDEVIATGHLSRERVGCANSSAVGICPGLQRERICAPHTLRR
jgi:hypothetical protein